MKRILKKIYDFLPFKKYVFGVLKKIWIPTPSIYQHLHFKGIITVYIDKEHSFKINHHGYQLENDIFWTGLGGSWERHSVRVWIELCKKAKAIFDIGSNTGLYSLVARAINKNAEVYAFEPVQRVYKKMLENRDINDFRFECIEKAVSNVTGHAILYDFDTDHEYSASLNNSILEDDSKKKQIEIETITLENFIEQNNLKQIDLIKIDVEMHEPEVLEGFGKYLRYFKPTILIEVLDDNMGKRISHFFEGLDYLYFNINEKKGIQQVDKIIQQVDKIDKGAGFNYLICNKSTAEYLKLSVNTTSQL